MSIGLAAGTDYGIFFMGRYQEARLAGEDKLTAYFTTYHGTAKVVLASGLTIAGAVFCLSFTRLPYFQPLGIPCAVGISIAVAVALTLVPAGMALEAVSACSSPGEGRGSAGGDESAPRSSAGRHPFLSRH